MGGPSDQILDIRVRVPHGLSIYPGETQIMAGLPERVYGLHRCTIEAINPAIDRPHFPHPLYRVGQVWKLRNNAQYRIKEVEHDAIRGVPITPMHQAERDLPSNMRWYGTGFVLPPGQGKHPFDLVEQVEFVPDGFVSPLTRAEFDGLAAEVAKLLQAGWSDITLQLQRIRDRAHNEECEGVERDKVLTAHADRIEALEKARSVNEGLRDLHRAINETFYGDTIKAGDKVRKKDNPAVTGPVLATYSAPLPDGINARPMAVVHITSVDLQHIYCFDQLEVTERDGQSV